LHAHPSPPFSKATHPSPAHSHSSLLHSYTSQHTHDLNCILNRQPGNSLQQSRPCRLECPGSERSHTLVACQGSAHDQRNWQPCQYCPFYDPW
jgi:hypothetical protein